MNVYIDASLLRHYIFTCCYLSHVEATAAKVPDDVHVER
jgi:hypothetical protein